MIYWCVSSNNQPSVKANTGISSVVLKKNTALDETYRLDRSSKNLEYK